MRRRSDSACMLGNMQPLLAQGHLKSTEQLFFTEYYLGTSLYTMLYNGSESFVWRFLQNITQGRKIVYSFYAILQKVYFWNKKYTAAHVTGYILDNRKGKVGLFFFNRDLSGLRKKILTQRHYYV